MMKTRSIETGADRAEARFRQMLKWGVARCGPIPALADTRQAVRRDARKALKLDGKRFARKMALAKVEEIRRRRALADKAKKAALAS